jgi:hypothetical protein
VGGLQPVTVDGLGEGEGKTENSVAGVLTRSVSTDNLATRRHCLKYKRRNDADAPATDLSRPAEVPPQLDTFEDRSAPGSLLDGLALAALGVPFADPLIEMMAAVGEGALAGSAGDPVLGAEGSPAHRGNVKLDRLSNGEETDLFTLEPGTGYEEKDGRRRSASPADFGGAWRGHPWYDPWLEDSLLLTTPAAMVHLTVGMSGAAEPALGEPTSISVSAAQSSRAPVQPAAAEDTLGVLGPSDPPITNAGGEKGLGNGPETIAAIELEEGDISNQAPVIADGAAFETDEDTPLTIQVSALVANASDADGDELFLADWDMELPNGTVERISETQLKYTPRPDFNGTETLGYAVSDGTDKGYGSVTITVNPVNDAPVSFDDGFVFYESPFPGTEYTLYVPDNDIDYDGDELSPVVVTQPAAGTGSVALNEYGDLIYVPPAGGLNGQEYLRTTFTYKVTDGTAESATSTVTVWLRPFETDPGTDGDPPPPPSVTAADDVFPVGDGAVTGTVTANDTGWDLAILGSHPEVGRLASFSGGGDFKFDPGPSDADAGFTYTVYRVDGSGFDTATVQLPAVNLEIFGQGAETSVRGENDEEEKIGAFTVVNRNDTDGDGWPDHEDPWVSPAGGPGNQTPYGIDEVDLMRLRVYRPNVPFDQQGTIRIDFTSANSAIYTFSDKNGIAPTQAGGPLGGFFTIQPQVFLSGGQVQPYKDYWVEVTQPSNSLRPVTVTMTYQGVTDTVKATGVWATMTNFRNTGNSLSSAADSPLFYSAFVASGGKLGLLTMDRATDAAIDAAPRMTPGAKAGYKTLYHTGNMMEMEFTVQPAQIALYPVVRFDITRSATVYRRYGVEPVQPMPGKVRDNYIDRANDEARGNIDNDVDLWWAAQASVNGGTGGLINKLYSFDRPGLQPEEWVHPRTVRFQQQGNFFEFVRIKIGSDFTPGLQGVQGSRASDYVNWHSWMDISPVVDPNDATNKIWARGPAARNEIKQDNGPHPNFEFQ